MLILNLMKVVLEVLGLVAHVVFGVVSRECTSEDGQAMAGHIACYLQVKRDNCDLLSTSNNWKVCIHADRRDRPDRKSFIH